MTKSTIRHQCRDKRAQLSQQSIDAASTAACQALIQLTVYQRAQTIAFYCAHQHEPSLIPALEHAWSTHKNVLIPKIDAHTCHFVIYRPTDTLHPNTYGILEHADTDPASYVKAPDIDLVIVPLVAVDATGNRIGHGKGHYDKTFKHKALNPTQKPFLLGIGYDFQKVTPFPSEPWDIALDGILLASTTPPPVQIESIDCNHQLPPLRNDA